MVYFKLTGEKLEKVLNYLKDKPWAEVAQIMVELTNLEKIEDKTEEKFKNDSLIDIRTE